MKIYLVNAESGRGYRAVLMEAEHTRILESVVQSPTDLPLAFKPVDAAYLQGEVSENLLSHGPRP